MPEKVPVVNKGKKSVKIVVRTEQKLNDRFPRNGSKEVMGLTIRREKSRKLAQEGQGGD